MDGIKPSPKQKALDDLVKAKSRLKAIEKKERKMLKEKRRREIQAEALALHEALSSGNREQAQKIATAISARSISKKEG